jgi:hypothetical protein
VILKTIGYLAGVRARVEFEAVYDAILIKNIMQLARIDSQSVLVANIDRDPAVLAKISNVLINGRPATKPS